MIQVHGDTTTAEHSAALQLRDLMVQAWPQVQTSDEHQVHLIAGAKCHGQKRRDIDVLLLASFGPGIAYSPFLEFQSGDSRVMPSHVEIRSLCCAIEVKDHPAESVRFEGQTLKVKYQGEWSDASEQSHEQKFSVKDFLESQGLTAPFVTSLIWLRNVSGTELPDRPHNILGARPTWPLIMSVIGQLSPPYSPGGRWQMAAFGSKASPFEDVARLFTFSLQPSKLDRERMERLAKHAATEGKLEATGSKLQVLRGRGGTGKTSLLLHEAMRLYEEEDARVLLLTYNKALVADIRRLLALMKIPDNITQQSIQIQTAHGFFHSVLSKMGLVQPGSTTFLQEFERLKAEALEMFAAGAASRDDLAASWSYIFVDEAQDWPHDERDLLLEICGPEHVIVADGVDQLVRSDKPTRWRENVSKSQSKLVPLKTCLRMKANLTRFVNSYARHMGLAGEEMLPNPDALGGRVVVLDGSYFGDRGFHERVLQANKDDLNEHLDMLFCVPPSLVRPDPEGGVQSVAAQVFSEWGYQVWDGASQDVREGCPLSLAQLRVVQYDSCRGLEGWATVNLHLDDFYEHKAEKFMPIETDGLSDPEQQAHLHAARWTMIPLTRAMDTLVINIHNPHSRVRTALEATAAECKDFLDWRTI
jgi:hypothetical protein